MKRSNLKKNILITGGAGFIGSNFVNLCANTEEIGSIFVLDKLTYAGDLNRITNSLKLANVEFIHEDIINIESFPNVISSIDFLINFAAETHVDNSINSPSEFITTNIVGTFKLLEACRLSNKSIRFMQISTDEVYGSVSVDASETDMLNPSSQYSASKASADLLTLANWKTHNQDVLISRSCNNFGPQQHREKLIPKSILKALSGEDLELYSEGLNIREWIYVEDNCEIIFNILKKGKPGEIYNIGTGIRKSNMEVAIAILELLPDSNSKIRHITDRLGHDFSYRLNIEKMRGEIQEMQITNFMDGLEKIINSYKKASSNFKSGAK
jgi:dTDP-glucose 4,6-dehydratase